DSRSGSSLNRYRLGRTVRGSRYGFSDTGWFPFLRLAHRTGMGSFAPGRIDSAGETGTVDHMTAVGSPADDPISDPGFHSKGEPGPRDRHQFGFDHHLFAFPGGGFVGDVDVGADRRLAGFL